MDKCQVGKLGSVDINPMTNGPAKGKIHVLPLYSSPSSTPLFQSLKTETSSHLGSCFRMAGEADILDPLL